MSVRDELHKLIDTLPEQEAERLLATLRADEEEDDDELAGYPASLRNAPLDDEPETDEEQAAVAEALGALARGDVVRNEDVAGELGWR